MVFIIIILAVFLGDLLLKKYVEAKLPEGEERALFRGRSVSANTTIQALPWEDFPGIR